MSENVSPQVTEEVKPSGPILPATSDKNVKPSSALPVVGTFAVALLLLTVTSPYWVLDLFPPQGESWPISVRKEIPGYTVREEELGKEVIAHYMGADLVSLVYTAPDRAQISAFAATWITGVGPDLVYGPHTPDVCYPAQGGICLDTTRELIYIDIEGRAVPFGRRVYKLRTGTNVLIYYANLLGGSTFLEVGDRIWTRFMMALRTRTDKRREQAYLLVTTPAGPTIEAADARLREFIPLWVSTRGTHGLIREQGEQTTALVPLQ